MSIDSECYPNMQCGKMSLLGSKLIDVWISFYCKLTINSSIKHVNDQEGSITSDMVI
jgi:hypothetical protein